MSERVIDYSRYRVAESIAVQWRAGDSAQHIGDAYFSFDPEPSMRAWLVELIVAAHDRKDRYAGVAKP